MLWTTFLHAVDNLSTCCGQNLCSQLVHYRDRVSSAAIATCVHVCSIGAMYESLLFNAVQLNVYYAHCILHLRFTSIRELMLSQSESKTHPPSIGYAATHDGGGQEVNVKSKHPLKHCHQQNTATPHICTHKDTH